LLSFTEIPSNRLHKLNLDHDRLKLNWLIDWNNREVLFYVQNAFDTGNKWFSLGFSSRGNFEKSDFCFFLRENDLYNVVLVSVANECGVPLSRPYRFRTPIRQTTARWSTKTSSKTAYSSAWTRPRLRSNGNSKRATRKISGCM
jgi:hypothetical protein